MIPLTPNSSIDMLPGTWNGSYNDLPGLGELSDWQGQVFMPNNFEQDVSHSSTSSSMDPALIHGSRTALEVVSDRNFGSTAEKAPSLSGWVNDLAKLNTSICAYNPIDNTSVIALEPQGYVGDNAIDRRDTRPESCRLDCETTFRMAMELSSLVKRLYTGRGRPFYTRSDSRIGPNPWHARLSNNNELQQLERQVSEILKDPSNILLLTSTYGRLLSLFNSIIQRNKAQSAPSDINVTVGTLDLANKPVMQSFVIVNMVELLVRRIDRVLKLVIKDVSSSIGPETPVAAHDIAFERTRTRYHSNHNLPDGNLRGLGFVLNVVGEQQTALLNSTSELRAQLLVAPDW